MGPAVVIVPVEVDAETPVLVEAPVLSPITIKMDRIFQPVGVDERADPNLASVDGPADALIHRVLLEQVLGQKKRHLDRYPLPRMVATEKRTSGSASS
jgi:hypothetical protein